jgi:hypothetical protein
MKIQHIFRLDPLTDRYLSALADHEGATEVALVVRAIREAARKRLPPDAREAAEKTPEKTSTDA